MLRFLKRYRGPLSIAAVVVLPLVIFRAHAVNPRDANILDRLVLLLTAPLERAVAWSTDAVAARWYTYVDVVGARRDNIEIRRRLVELERGSAEMDALRTENSELRALLDLRARQSELRTVPAAVIGATGSPFTNALRIDRGLVQGIRRGMAVIAPEGVVGRVQRVAFNSAEVMLLLDSEISLDVFTARGRARGRVIGRAPDAPHALLVTGVASADDVVVGDEIVTTGLGGVFPKDVPVGKVLELRPVPGANDRDLLVEPAVTIRRLEQVLVVLDMDLYAEPIATPNALLPPDLAESETGTVAD